LAIDNIYIHLIGIIIGTILLLKVYDWWVVLIFEIGIFITLGIIVLIPKWYSYNSKYIILGVLIVIIINNKKYKEYFKMKIKQIFKK
jgi:hypothetical protein